MALIQWRRFMFFDKELVREPGAPPNVPHPGLQGLNITASTCGRGHLVFGDSKGFIHFVDRSFSIGSFPAFEMRVTHLHQLKQSNILISIGEDLEGINPMMKVFNRDKADKAGNPACVKTIKLLYNNKATAVSQVAVCESLSQVAVGLCNGAVILIKSDVSRDRFIRQKVAFEAKEPITGLSFREQGKTIALFIVTPSKVVSLYTAGGHRDGPEVLFEQGAELNCCISSDPDQDMVIGRNEAVYFYEPDGQGPCYAFEGDKKLMGWFRSYLVVVNDQKGGANKLNPVSIYDIDNKFTAFTGAIPDVVAVLSEWGALYLLTGDRKLYQLEEKDTQSKLDMLFRKNLYHHAIQLAQSQHYDRESINEIFTKYGDHLYAKGDFDAAIAQYVRTIGYLEPSYVIRKFLDAQRIHNLTSYLQALHEKNQAGADHTTLLLNCYTKLKDDTRLDEFIMTEREVYFDVETAIKVCRQAGYQKHALYLARRFAQHDWFLRIQLEDLKNYQDALEYMHTLPFAEAERNLKDYGKALVNALPDLTTKFLIELCTRYERRNLDGTLYTGKTSSERCKPDEFIHIYVDRPTHLRSFLEHVVTTPTSTTSSAAIYNTLLELYLQPGGKKENLESVKERHEKAMELLRSTDAQYDIDHAMVLTQTYNFRRGILHLYEKARLFQEMVLYYMENEADDSHAQIISICKKHGQQDSSLWVQVLTYFANSSQDCGAEISECLTHIDKQNILPPLLVVQILSKNSTATLAVVKDYVARRLQQENQYIMEDERRIRKYKEETKKMRNEIESLKTTAKVFMNAKCAACTGPLELPTVHFLCSHSYHVRCLGDNERECPVCAPENHKVLDIIRAQEQSADQHELFFKQLDGTAGDGFQVVAEFFGRNLFSKTVLVDNRRGADTAGPSSESYS